MKSTCNAAIAESFPYSSASIEVGCWTLRNYSGKALNRALLLRLRSLDFIMPLNNAKAIFAASDPEFVSFPSRRSVVHSTKGIVACTQPLAAQAGIRVLHEGGNAAVSPAI